MEISDLITELERHKVKFIPSKAEYVNFVFVLNAEIVERLHPGERLSCHYQELYRRMVEHLEYDVERAKDNYFNKNNSLTGLYVPPVNRLKAMAKETILWERKNKIG